MNDEQEAYRDLAFATANVIVAALRPLMALRDPRAPSNLREPRERSACAVLAFTDDGEMDSTALHEMKDTVVQSIGFDGWIGRFAVPKMDIDDGPSYTAGKDGEPIIRALVRLDGNVPVLEVVWRLEPDPD